MCVFGSVCNECLGGGKINSIGGYVCGAYPRFL